MKFTQLTCTEWQNLPRHQDPNSYPPQFVVRCGANIFVSYLRWGELEQKNYFVVPSLHQGIFLDDALIEEVYRIELTYTVKP